MRTILEVITEPLDAVLRQRIVERYQAFLESEEHEHSALIEALGDYPDVYPPQWWLNPSLCRWWLRVHVDWKATDEVIWQVQAVARTLGIPGVFDWQGPPNLNASHMLDMLRDATRWFEVRGVLLVGVNTGGDEYLLLPVVPHRLEALKAALAQHDLSTQLYG